MVFKLFSKSISLNSPIQIGHSLSSCLVGSYCYLFKESISFNERSYLSLLSLYAAQQIQGQHKQIVIKRQKIADK